MYNTDHFQAERLEQERENAQAAFGSLTRDLMDFARMERSLARQERRRMVEDLEAV